MPALVKAPRRNICHLVADGERATACGLVRVSDMHLRLFAVREIPPHCTLCKHCERAGVEAGQSISHVHAPNAPHVRPRNA